MNVRDLRSTVIEIQEICDKAGASKMANDLKDLCQIFDGHDDETVEAFIDHLDRLYAPSTPKPRQSEDADRLIVQAYVQRLRAHGGDPAGFSLLVAELRSDQKVTLAEANAIQHGFIGGREAWPTQKAAITAIEKGVESSRYQDAVLEDIKNVTPW